ncbi:hypothetical protein BUALT_Bualt04G0082500 [Buddleja alternifolia]|uniref:Core-2/I-branching beta-1,6-N-acetylglucosaminyltransferase family protein n=1 Tax=Buddleja alternifolia TaxID=168488 RepID=A0AAV6XM98_9LAMI|nr:hypothetical protein BUALT_Bualt04G0082500 [Buddleja alternifolia]
MHNMSDDELLSKASTVQDENNNNVVGNYKVAFMFLTPGRLPLAPFWDRFFKGYEGKYSIYVHPHPSYNESVPQDSAFFARRIPSQPVYWGQLTMIDAERRLLANALLDPSNQRFVLLSDSCIPVFNFTTVYNHIMGTNLSSLQIFDDPRKAGRGRYIPHMWPEVTIEQWRKGSQWFEIHRELAVKIVSDKKYYKLFSEFCVQPCFNDEHYLPTLVNILFPEMNSNRTLTWVDWSRGGPHPRKFGWIDVKVEMLNHIRFDYECEYNGNTTNICHLFARKFLPNTLRPLLKIAPSLLGLSVGVVSTLCLRSFSFTIPSPLSFCIPPSIISKPSLLFISPSPPPPDQLVPVAPNGTDDVSSKNKNQGFGLMHNMSDDELLSRASTVRDESNNNVSNYKVAFMFLTPGRLPLAPFWDRFFKGHEGKYSIYVHPHPSYNESVPQDSAFYARRIPSQPVYWGTISMIDAERRLLANALLHPSNQRFVLLSDSCIPVFNFTTVYNHLMGTNLSSLQMYDDPRRSGRGRYNRQMWPEVTIEHWRKGSQWKFLPSTLRPLLKIAPSVLERGGGEMADLRMKVGPGVVGGVVGWLRGEG